MREHKRCPSCFDEIFNGEVEGKTIKSIDGETYCIDCADLKLKNVGREGKMKRAIFTFGEDCHFVMSEETRHEKDVAELDGILGDITKFSEALDTMKKEITEFFDDAGIKIVGDLNIKLKVEEVESND